jgi:glycosyltransferase involved in cell wall biosynthesis
MSIVIDELPDPFSVRDRYAHWQKKIIRRSMERFGRFVRSGRRIALGINDTQGQSTQGLLDPILGYESSIEGDIKGRALLIYLAAPFRMKPADLMYSSHTNLLQSVEIARALNRLGYIVDIVDWMDSEFIPSEKYDVMIGLHTNFERLETYLEDSVPRVYYATGAYWEIEIEAERARIEDLKRRRQVDYQIPVRLGRNDWVQMADAVIHMGNEVVAGPYRRHNSDVYSIDNFTLPLTKPLTSYRDFDQVKRNFLWFGGTGLLHKGLDLVLEAFSELPDCHLWVCGPIYLESEREFLRIYRNELFHQENVHPMGWMSIYSRSFDFLTDQCGFQISVSCSEAGGGAVLNCLGRGIVPLLHKNVGIDVDDIGFMIQHDSVSSIKEAVLQAVGISDAQYKRLSYNAYQQSIGKYSIESFRSNIESALATILAANHAVQ